MENVFEGFQQVIAANKREIKADKDKVLRAAGCLSQFAAGEITADEMQVMLAKHFNTEWKG